MEEKDRTEERESEFSDDHSERSAEIEAFKLGLRKAQRTKKYLLAAIPLFVCAAIWIVILISSLASAASRSVKKFDISYTPLKYVSSDYEHIEFDVSVKNNSKHDAYRIDMTLSFFDGKALIGTLPIYTQSTLDSKEEKAYTVKMSERTLDDGVYDDLLERDLSKIAVEAKITEIEFLGESNDSGNSFIFIFLAAISVGICAGWVVHVYVNTFCKKCKTPLVVKTVGRREVDRHPASWNERRSVKDKKGNEIYTYEERVSGEEIEYEYKRKCSCCGNVTYRKSFDRIAK